jgi:hypothetical protein
LSEIFKFLSQIEQGGFPHSFNANYLALI